MIHGFHIYDDVILFNEGEKAMYFKQMKWKNHIKPNRN